MTNDYLSIIAKISSIKPDIGDIKEDMSLVDDLAFDSVSFVSMIITIEDVYSFEFDEEYISFEKLKTIRDVAEYIEFKLRKT